MSKNWITKSVNTFDSINVSKKKENGEKSSLVNHISLDFSLFFFYIYLYPRHPPSRSSSWSQPQATSLGDKKLKSQLGLIAITRVSRSSQYAPPECGPFVMLNPSALKKKLLIHSRIGSHYWKQMSLGCGSKRHEVCCRIHRRDWSDGTKPTGRRQTETASLGICQRLRHVNLYCQ
jgi:hypothetical protein